MKVINSLLTVVLMPLVFTNSLAAPDPMNSIVQANNGFAVNLYARLKGNPGNLFVSPYSISTCLAMTWAGARGTTEAEMARVLHFQGSLEQIHSGFAALQQQLRQAENQKGITLNIANGLWAQQGHPFLPAFLAVARQEYGANVRQVDFRSAAPAVTKEINQWVADETRDRIKDILAPGALNSDSRLVLANAIYFKGTWAVPFNKSATRPQPFHLTPTQQVNVPFMSHTDTVNYFENEELQVAELPYAGGELAMVILLPRQVEGCPNLEKSLQVSQLNNWLGQLREQKVQLFIPKFKLDSGFSLQGVLAAMGMPEAFSAKADFSGMDGARDLFISSVAHKAWVEVNEEGTEAAAATTAVMGLTAMRRPLPLPVFRADHPFIFLIRDTRSGSVLFLGRLAEPAG